MDALQCVLVIVLVWIILWLPDLLEQIVLEIEMKQPDYATVFVWTVILLAIYFVLKG